MEWIGPTDARYDEQRALFNAMIDKRPRLIAACETPADIRSALDRARDDGLEVAVRSGGHAVAGQSTNDDGLVIDVRALTASKSMRPPDGRASVVGAPGRTSMPQPSNMGSPPRAVGSPRPVSPA